MFTTDPARLGGELISTKIVKGAKGLGFTLIGNDSSSRGDEFIQVSMDIHGNSLKPLFGFKLFPLLKLSNNIVKRFKIFFLIKKNSIFYFSCLLSFKLLK